MYNTNFNMYSILKVTLILVNIFSFSSATGEEEPEIIEVSGVKYDTSKIPQNEAVQISQEMLEKVKTIYPNAGALLFDFLTSPQTLGDDIGKAFWLQEKDVATGGKEKLGQAIDLVIAVINENFSWSKIKPILDNVGGVTTKDGKSLKRAIDIVFDVFTNPEKREIIRQRLTAP